MPLRAPTSAAGRRVRVYCEDVDHFPIEDDRHSPAVAKLLPVPEEFSRTPNTRDKVSDKAAFLCK